MQIIRGFDHIPTYTKAVATVGSYDGLHSGHSVLLDRVKQRAKALDAVSMVITFEPHPRITLGQDEGLKLLTTLEEKALLLDKMGIDFMMVIPFDRAFSQLSHQQFIEHYLVGKLCVAELIVGYNHHFGHNKSGDYNYLSSNQAPLTVTQVEQQRVESQKVSSTIIRQTIERGDMALAAQLLGHNYIIIGQSDSNGNIVPSPYKLLPPSGKYRAVVDNSREEVTIEQGAIYCSVKNKTVKIELC